MTDRIEEAWEKYRSDGSEGALRTVLRAVMEAHSGQVYAVALRRCGGRVDWAEDATQAAFRELARKAGTLPRGTVPGGWLCRCAIFKSSEIQRAETRRRKREREAAQELSLVAGTSPCFPAFPAGESDDGKPPWPALEEALNGLPATDRQALRLRFYEGLSLRQLGQTLGISEDTAQKRVSRTLRRLREILLRRGVKGTAGSSLVLVAGGMTGTPSGAAAAGVAPAAAGMMPGAAAAAGMGAGSAAAASGGQVAGFIQWLTFMTAKTKITLGAAGLCALMAVPLCLQQQRIREQSGRITDLSRRLELNLGLDGRGAAVAANPPPGRGKPGMPAEGPGTSSGGTVALEKILREPDPLRRINAFTAFLKNMTGAEAPAMLELMLDLSDAGVSMDTEGPLFLQAWGEKDGPGAIAVAMESRQKGKQGASGEDLSIIMSGWAASNPQEAVAWLQSLPADKYPENRDKLMAGIASGWSAKDMDAAGRWIESLPPTDAQGGMIDVLVKRINATRGPESMQRWFEGIVPTEGNAAFRRRAFDEIGERLARTDVTRAVDWLDQHADLPGAASGPAAFTILSTWAEQHGSAAADWALAHMETGKPESERTPLSAAVSAWAEKDPNAVGQWLSTKTGQPGYDRAAAAFSFTIQETDAESAFAWAGTIQDSKLRKERRITTGVNWMSTAPPEKKEVISGLLKAEGFEFPDPFSAVGAASP